MKKNVLIIGNCGSDFLDLSSLIEIKFSAKAHKALSIYEAKKMLEKNQNFDLILTNRSGFFDHKPGILILDYLKENSLNIPTFLLSGEKESIAKAMQKGAAGGFSKDEIYSDEEKAHVTSLLKDYLKAI